MKEEGGCLHENEISQKNRSRDRKSRAKHVARMNIAKTGAVALRVTLRNIVSSLCVGGVSSRRSLLRIPSIRIRPRLKPKIISWTQNRQHGWAYTIVQPIGEATCSQTCHSIEELPLTEVIRNKNIFSLCGY